ncbi:hypothetical protein GWI33_002472 [Rhynchophorus ferrugineus]|uniref:Regulatory protein zeste n=1 Tax=Rhynchophorus ferrugineus TaxID=354439 RepID=A0A834IVW4_RHYFE|nr:hypothetical protein GWI33_002472 [Rhynchophorus ferrugineus]
MSRLRPFTPEEVIFVEALLEKNKDILNTTIGDFEMRKRENECWINIEKEFNSFSDLPRSISMLKKKCRKIKNNEPLLSEESLRSKQKTRNFKKNMLASVVTGPHNDTISRPSDFDEEDDFETSKLLKLTNNERPSSENSEPNSSQENPQQIDNKEEEVIKLMREKQQMELALTKKKSGNIIDIERLIA